MFPILLNFRIYKGVIIRMIYDVSKFSFELLGRVLSKELRSSYIPHCLTVNPYSLRCIYTTPAIEHYLQQKRRTGSYEEWSLHTSGSYFEEIHGKSNKKSENISSHIKFLFCSKNSLLIVRFLFRWKYFLKIFF